MNIARRPMYAQITTDYMSVKNYPFVIANILEPPTGDYDKWHLVHQAVVAALALPPRYMEISHRDVVVSLPTGAALVTFGIGNSGLEDIPEKDQAWITRMGENLYTRNKVDGIESY